MSGPNRYRSIDNPAGGALGGPLHPLSSAPLAETLREKRMGIYLSPVWHTILPQYRAEFGYIVAPKETGTSGAQRGIEAGQPWMFDNGMYAGTFDGTLWAKRLAAAYAYRATCLGVVVPDVLTRHDDGTVTGDWQATVAQFHEYAPIVQEYGYPVAFVSQDGLPVDAAPWDAFDVLFIGGSDQHKLTESWPLIAEAKRRGKWVHVGRVNSAKRIALFWMADSWDGTMLAKEPSPARQQYMLNAARHATTRAQGQQGSLFDALYQPLPYGYCVGEPVHGDVRP